MISPSICGLGIGFTCLPTGSDLIVRFTNSGGTSVGGEENTVNHTDMIGTKKLESIHGGKGHFGKTR